MGVRVSSLGLTFHHMATEGLCSSQLGWVGVNVEHENKEQPKTQGPPEDPLLETLVESRKYAGAWRNLGMWLVGRVQR